MFSTGNRARLAYISMLPTVWLASLKLVAASNPQIMTRGPLGTKGRAEGLLLH